MKVRCDFAVVSSKKTKTCSTHGRALVEWEMSAVAKDKNRAERFKEKRYISRHILILLSTVMCFPCPSFLLNPFDWFQKGLGWKR